MTPKSMERVIVVGQRNIYLPDNGSDMHGSVSYNTPPNDTVVPQGTTVINLRYNFRLNMKPSAGYTPVVIADGLDLSKDIKYSDGYYVFSDPDPDAASIEITVRFVLITYKICLDTSVAVKQLMILDSSGQPVDVTAKLLSM